MKLLGFRVFNRCTREVLVSRPPSSQATVDVPPDERCRETATATPDSAPKIEVKPELSREELSAAMSAIRPQVQACYRRFQVPGRAILQFVVLDDGRLQTVRLEGAFAETPTGACLLEAARAARFPTFSGPPQHFDYPLFLRAS